LNGTVKIPGKVFENLGIRFECTLFDRISGIIENFSVPFAGDVGFATLQKNSSICFSGKIAGRPDELPVGIRPVCIIGCVLVYRYTEGITIVLLSLRTFV